MQNAVVTHDGHKQLGVQWTTRDQKALGEASTPNRFTASRAAKPHSATEGAYLDTSGHPPCSLSSSAATWPAAAADTVADTVAVAATAVRRPSPAPAPPSEEVRPRRQKRLDTSWVPTVKLK
ncbi:hypothetical protein AAE478_002981 [Parahypoxylon ruwenzoriense]